MNSSRNVKNLFDLSGKAALVTGAATGIGRASALALAQAGASVTILDRNVTEGESAAAALANAGHRVRFVKCDITSDEQVSDGIASVIEHFGHLDIAINCAGTISPGTALEQSRQEWDRVIEINLTALWRNARAQAKQMIAQGPMGGKIVNIGSVWGTRAGGNASYVSSKAAVIHLTHRLAVEWGSYNINVNCISPGWVITPLLSNAVEDLDSFCQRAKEIIPLGYVARPSDLAGAVTFLSSEASDYVTGLDLIIDGGHSLETWFSPLTRKYAPRSSISELARKASGEI